MKPKEKLRVVIPHDHTIQPGEMVQPLEYYQDWVKCSLIVAIPITKVKPLHIHPEHQQTHD